MHDLGRKVKTLIRRRDYLKKRLDKFGDKNTSKSYDTAEMSALCAAITIMELYRDSVGSEGKAHVYGTIDYVASVLEESLTAGVNASKTSEAIDRCEDSLDILEGMRSADTA